jgi:hypothetical protein
MGQDGWGERELEEIIAKKGRSEKRKTFLIKINVLTDKDISLYNIFFY